MESQQLAIIGLGNPLREDDGIGPRVVEDLASRGLPEDVVVLVGGTGGLELLELLQGWRRVVVVDAAQMGRAPGDFVRFSPDQVRLAETADRFSFHHAGLPEVMSLARALQRQLPPITVFGVQPGQVGWREGLTPEVEEALPMLIDAILQEVGEGNVQDPDN